MTDALDDLSLNRFGQRVAHGLALITVFTAELDLDQFMVLKGEVEFINDALGEAMLAKHHQGFEAVAEAFEVLDLRLAQWLGLVGHGFG